MSNNVTVDSLPIAANLSATGSPEIVLGRSASSRTIEGASTSTSTATATSTPMSISAAAPSPRHATADEVIKYGILFPYTIKDVNISEQEDQPTAKGSRNVNTRLVSIGSVLTINMDTKQLRNWGNRENMSLRNGSKASYAVAIVAFTEQHRRMQEQGRDTAQPESIYARNKINFTRFINVLAYEPIKARLILRGQQITRSDLDNGVQADEELWREFTKVYNRPVGTLPPIDMLRYSIDWAGNTPNPASYTPIEWKKAQSSFKELCKKYDMAHKRWKASGWHDDFLAPTQPFSDYVRQQWLVYLHEFLLENPGILATITSDLAEDTHFESSTGLSDDEELGAPTAAAASTMNASAPAHNNNSRQKGKRKSSDGREDIFRNIAQSTKLSAVSNEKKSRAIRLAAVTQSRSTMQAMLNSSKEQKKVALKSLKEHPFSNRNNARIRITVNHLRKREVEQKKSNAANSSNDGDSDSDSETFPLSQETTNSIRALNSFDTVFGLAKEYNDASKQIAMYEKDLKKMKIAAAKMDEENASKPASK